MRTKSELMIVAGILVLSAATSLQAATITVTDDSGGTGGPDCTLRDAITAANTDTATGGCIAGSGADTIDLPAGATITLTVADNFDSQGDTGLPSITSEVSINGNGAIVERSGAAGTPLFRILKIEIPGNLTLDHLTVAGGDALVAGGILNPGTMTMTNSTVSGNRAANAGGGILNVGTMTLTDSTVSGNNAAVAGGILCDGTMTLTNSTVSENFTTNNGGDSDIGGGIVIFSGTVTLTNSTVSENIAEFAGAIFFNGGTLTMTNSTVSGNRAINGGGIYVESVCGGVCDGTVTLTNSIVANTIGGAVDCSGTIIDNGFNIVEDGSCISAPTSMSGDPNLGPLADNGGPTKTHALHPGSIALDAGDCAGGTTIEDQRGVSRPQSGACDIGSYEEIVPQVCGNGEVEGSEDCDDGNTEDGDCCSSTCNLDPAGMACGDSSNTVCDNPDTCDDSGSCQLNHEPVTTECRADAGDCDVAESCDGAGSCPDDGFEPADTACSDDSDTVCDNPDTCDDSGSCQLNHEPATTECRAATGDCDVAESCDGAGSCPDDGFEPADTACGDDSDTVCDAPDTCDDSGSCQLNPEPATTECRADTGDCDVVESCDGAGSCPDDGFEPTGTNCGDSSDSECDGADTCDGGGFCDDNIQLFGAPCDDGEACTSSDGGEGTYDACDGGGTCLGTPIECEVGVCDPSSGLCAETIIENMIEEVEALGDSGDLNRGQEHSLTTKLSLVVRHLFNGQFNAACGQLRSFTHQVTAFSAKKILTPEQGQPLIDSAVAVLDAVGCSPQDMEKSRDGRVRTAGRPTGH